MRKIISNNYLAIDINGKIKRKGAFKLHEEMIKDGEYHKAFSQAIVPIAVSEYFLNDITPEQTIKNNKDIFNFCKTFNATHGWKCETIKLDENKNIIKINNEQKNNRYYISKNGVKFRKRGEPLKPRYNKNFEYKSQDDEIKLSKIKTKIELKIYDLIDKQIVEHRGQVNITINCNGDIYSLLSRYSAHLNYILEVCTVELNKSEIFSYSCDKAWRLIDIESEGLVTIFNKYEDKNFDDYQIDHDYYIEECNKIIDLITGKKERLENERKLEKETEIKNKQEENYIKFCINKLPTERQYNEYRKQWMDGIYPEIIEFKKSAKKKEAE